MKRSILLLFPLWLSISYSTQFANEIFKYDNLELFPKRIVESIVVPKHIDDVAYISFSAEEEMNTSEGGNSSSTDHVGCNPIVAKVVLEGLIEILWTTSLEIGMSKTRHTSLSLSPDGKKLYVTATFFNVNETDHKFQVLSINAEDGERENSIFVSTLLGSQVVRAIAVNKMGIYICGRSTTATFEKDTQIESIQEWDLLLCQISFSGNLNWQYTKNVANKTCEDIELHDGNVYTTGKTWMNDSVLGMVYKHTGEGGLVWGRRVRSTLNLTMKSNEILVNDDGIFLSSYLSHPRMGTRSFIQKFSNAGTILWSRELGEGIPAGIGYRTGYLFGVTAGNSGLNMGTGITRMDRFGEDSEMIGIEINSTAGVLLKSTWVGLSNAFLMIHKTDRHIIYGVGTEDSDVVDDTTIGEEEYEIRITMHLQEKDVQSIKDYLSDTTHGGNVRCSMKQGLVVVTIVVREPSLTKFSQTFKRVEARLVRQNDGKSEIERDLDIEIEVVANEFRNLETTGSGPGGKVGAIVAICVAVGFVVVVVCFWFCVSKWFSFAVGEHVAMV